MPVQLIKPNPEAAQRAAERAAEAHDAMIRFARAVAPAVRRAGQEMARSFAALKPR